MTPETRRAAAAGTASILLGVAVGRLLLNSMNTRDPRVLAALAQHADPLPSPAPPAPDPASENPDRQPSILPDRLVIALVDGLGETPFREAVSGTRLQNHEWEATVDCGTPSLSRPIYHVLLTGVPQSVSGIRNNTHQGPARADTLPARVRESGGTVGWALQTVPWFHDLAGAPEDPYERLGEEPLLNPVTDAFDPPNPPLETRFTKMAAVLAKTPTLTILHFIEVDHAGHHSGSTSPAYKKAASEAIQAIVTLRETHSHTPEGARTVWMIGADHGHLSRGGHGGPELEVRRTTWIGVWPDQPPAQQAPSTQAPSTQAPSTQAPYLRPVVVPDIVHADRLASTFAAVLNVPAPRESLGEPLPLPDRPVAPTPSLTARKEAVTRAVLEADTAARTAVLARAAAALLALLAIMALQLRGPARREKTLYLLGATWPVLAAALGFWALGPGTTLSAIRTHFAFSTSALFAVALGSALTYPVVKRCRTPLLWLAISAGALPAAAYAITAGSMGESRLPDALLLLFPATGVFPTGILGGLALAAAIDRLRLLAQSAQRRSSLRNS